MHRRMAAMTLLLVSVIFISGCTSGQTARRQAAEMPANSTPLSASASDYYEDDAPEAACTCPSSMRTCQDGFSATCENTCSSGECQRCVPTCLGHEACNSSWFCGEWQPCSGGNQSRACIDRSGCNSSDRQERRPCPDSCSSDADCPAEADCRRHICEGTPKSCRPYLIIPCCGDGICDTGEVCEPDCPVQPQPAQNQTNQPSQNQTSNQTNQTQPQTPTYFANVTIINVTYKLPDEFVEITNLGTGSADMDGWNLSDAPTASNKTNTFTFPAFVLGPGSVVRVHTANGTGSQTDIFWNRSCRTGNTFQCVWNDGGDTATLKNINGTASTFTYTV